MWRGESDRPVEQSWLVECDAHHRGLEGIGTVSVYHPAIGIWGSTTNLSTPRDGHTTTLLQNGKVLVLGEFSAELYHPDTGTWTSVGILSGDIGRYRHTATLLPDGRVLIVGGETSLGGPIRDALLYHPDTGEWSSTMHLIHYRARINHTATLLPDGKVLVAGG